MFLKSNWTGTCAVTKKYRQVRRGVKNKKKKEKIWWAKKKHKKLCYAWSDRAIGPQC